MTKVAVWAVLLLGLFAVRAAAADPLSAQGPGPGVLPNQAQPEFEREVRHDVSRPLGQIPPLREERGPHEIPLRRGSTLGPTGVPDSVLQAAAGPLAVTTPGLNFAGVGNGDYGFVPNAAPPDTNGAVGATQYVQWVNESFAVFDKSTGQLLYGPAAGNTLWAGFGGGCQTNNDGDPIAQYDKAANRWVMTQFAVSTKPYLQCVAVSTSADATGSYYRYSFNYGNRLFPDYPKLGVWPDAYYISFNMFTGNTFSGGRACAYDRNAMLAGAAATQICFQLNSGFGLLPSDLDGSIGPPPGSPSFLLNFGANSLNLWKFHVDFSTPTNSTFTGPTNISVAAFSPACGGAACIPQPNTSQRLDSLGDRLMYRLAYRRFADGHEALVVNHSVNPGNGTSGIRWYELRNPNGAPTVYQQGTFAPDSNYRWMGSIAMDRLGNIAVGYSVSSGSVFPSIRYAGRVPSDPLGTLQAETTVLSGGGSQLPNLERWGDYSAMTVDPLDDCTFWYTTEYLKANGTFNWSTRIASFKYPSCTPLATPTPTMTPSSMSTVTPTGTPLSPTATPINSPAPTNTLSPSMTATPTATPTATNPSVLGHQLSAVATGGIDVAVFGRNSLNELWYRETTSGVFDNWTMLGSGIASRPEATLSGSDLYVFFRTTTNELRYFKRSAGVWGSEQNLGGVIAGNPVAAIDGDGDIIVAMMNASGNIFYQRAVGGVWSGFISLAGTLHGQLELITYNGDVYLFGLSTADNLWAQVWTSSSNSWGGWVLLGGVLSGAPAAALSGPDLYVFAINREGALFYRALSGGSWGAWTPLDGLLGGAPDAVTTGSRTFVFGVSPTGNLWNRQFSGSWGPWDSLEGTAISGPEAVAAGGTVAYVFVVNSAGNLWYRQWGGSSWGPFTNLGGALQSV